MSLKEKLDGSKEARVHSHSPFLEPIVWLSGPLDHLFYFPEPKYSRAGRRNSTIKSTSQTISHLTKVPIFVTFRNPAQIVGILKIDYRSDLLYEVIAPTIRGQRLAQLSIFRFGA